MKRVFEQWLSCMHKIQSMAILSLLVLSLQSTHAQSICNTSEGAESIGAIEDRSNCPQKVTDDPIYIRIYVHSVGKSDSTDAPSIDYINSSLSILKEDFLPHKIFFIRDCEITYIYSDEIYYANVPSQIECELPQYSNHPDGIDVFIGGDNATPYNAAITVPGKTMIVKGSYQSDGGGGIACPQGVQWVNSRSHTISHEMGHCLGLWHTHHGVEFAGATFCNGVLADPNKCEEYVDGSNAADCGDYVCDTPADPGLDPCSSGIYNNCNYDF